MPRWKSSTSAASRPVRRVAFIRMSLVMCLVALPACHGWADEGHLLVGATARLLMPGQAVESLEKLLRVASPLYDRLDRIDAAAVWADHIKCRVKTPWCEGFPRMTAMEVFNPFHYIDLPYNPEKLSAPRPERANARTFLQETLVSLRDFGKAQHGGSAFSWLFSLAMLLHVWGDVHQPLHTCTLINKAFPQGDNGGNEVKVVVPEPWPYETVHNLHQLWDLGGGPKSNSWPKYLGNLTAAAEDLLERKKNITKSAAAKIIDPVYVVSQSHKLCQKLVYRDAEHVSPDEPFEATAEYIQNVQDESENQIVLGGARLARLLTEIAANAPNPEDLFPGVSPPPPRHSKFSWSVLIAAAVTALIVWTFAVFQLSVWYYKKRNKRQFLALRDEQVALRAT